MDGQSIQYPTRECQMNQMFFLTVFSLLIDQATEDEERIDHRSPNTGGHHQREKTAQRERKGGLCERGGSQRRRTEREQANRERESRSQRLHLNLLVASFFLDDRFLLFIHSSRQAK